MTVKELADCGLFRALNIGDEYISIDKQFSCDLLSVVMTKNLSGHAWFTVIGNINTIAVAVHTKSACVVLCEGVQPDSAALEKAREHNVTVFTSDEPIFDSALVLYALTDDK